MYAYRIGCEDGRERQQDGIHCGILYGIWKICRNVDMLNRHKTEHTSSFYTLCVSACMYGVGDVLMMTIF